MVPRCKDDVIRSTQVEKLERGGGRGYIENPGKIKARPRTRVSWGGRFHANVDISTRGAAGIAAGATGGATSARISCKPRMSDSGVKKCN